MNDYDWLIMLIIAPLGMAQLHSEGKLNFNGLIVEPVLSIISLFRH